MLKHVWMGVVVGLMVSACSSSSSGTSSGSTGGSGSTGSTGQPQGVVDVEAGATVKFIVPAAQAVIFTATVGGAEVIQRAEVVNNAVVVTTLCTTASGSLTALTVQGAEVHALAVNLVGASKLVKSTTTATGGACTDVGTVNPQLQSTLVRVGSKLFYAGNGQQDFPISQYDLTSNTESTVLAAPPTHLPGDLGTDGTHLFGAESGSGSAFELIRFAPDGTGRASYKTFADASKAGFVVGGANVFWLEGSSLAKASVTGTPGAPTVGPDLGAGSDPLAFCGAQDSQTVVYAIASGTKTGWWSVATDPTASPVKLSTGGFAVSTSPCVYGTNTFWFIDNAGALHLKFH
jgi:hypothetical protein